MRFELITPPIQSSYRDASLPKMGLIARITDMEWAKENQYHTNPVPLKINGVEYEKSSLCVWSGKSCRDYGIKEAPNGWYLVHTNDWVQNDWKEEELHHLSELVKECCDVF